MAAVDKMKDNGENCTDPNGVVSAAHGSLQEGAASESQSFKQAGAMAPALRVSQDGGAAIFSSALPLPEESREALIAFFFKRQPDQVLSMVVGNSGSLVDSIVALAPLVSKLSEHIWGRHPKETDEMQESENYGDWDLAPTPSANELGDDTSQVVRSTSDGANPPKDE